MLLRIFCAPPIATRHSMPFFTDVPMISFLKYPARKTFSLAPTLACLCLLFGAGRSPAAPVALSIPGTVTLVTAQPGQINFRFPSEPGGNYTLEQSEHLADPTWTSLETRAGDGTTIQFTRPIGAAPTFFRVRQEQ